MRISSLSLVVLLGTGCAIPEAGFKLGVPYRAQETIFYCAPACVQMWRAYDGLTPAYSQQYLFDAMNGTIGCGASTQEIERAVQTFTSARDAYYDLVTGANQVELDGYFSRQVTSVDSRTPVMVLAHQHAIVVNGGKWHPDRGANLRLSSNQWLLESCYFFTCGQIVSEDAVQGWEANLTYWGGDLVVPGNPRHDGPPPV
ncbi:MAG: hypothetical protein SF066_05415 [Thermoanaerobaculia bacterium]|nr:hypothetical protein [Thermoanaerobaculia bacterium]